MAETPLPTVALGRSDIRVTRLISGANPLVGNSHFSRDMDAEMREYFTPERVVRYLQDLQDAGINALQARGDYHRVLHWVELFRREGGRLHWIAQTASEMHDVFQNIRVLVAAGACAVYHHGTKTDNLWLDGRIDEVEDSLKAIRDTGAQVGLGTHVPEVIEYAEEKGWDVDFYMACFYNLSRAKRESAVVDPSARTEEEGFPSEDPPRMCETIRATDKMCLAFKILGAGRRCRTQEDVRTAFRFAFDNIKSGDAVVVGMFPKREDQIGRNVRYTMEALGRAGGP